MPTVLVVDDDRKLIEMLRRTLAYEGYQVLTAADGPSALTLVQSKRPDLVVLDWMLPALDGLAVAKSIRSSGTTPILMLTARDGIEDRVTGLDTGADDFLGKPFAPQELLARVRALLRRAEPSGAAPLSFADLTLDPALRTASRGSHSVSVSPREFELLALLLRHPRQVLPRERIIEAVWGVDGSNEVLEVYIGYLRAKTETGGAPRLIQTVRGVGYVLREEPV